MTTTNPYAGLTRIELEAEESALQAALESVRGKVSPWRPIESAPAASTADGGEPYGGGELCSHCGELLDHCATYFDDGRVICEECEGEHS